MDRSRPLGSRSQETARLIAILESSDSSEIADVADHMGRLREQRLVGQADRAQTSARMEAVLLKDRSDVGGEAWSPDQPVAGSLRHGELTLENVDAAFQYQPWNPVQQAAGEMVREGLVIAAKAILRNVPPCADRTVALRKLREARMDANSAITFSTSR